MYFELEKKIKEKYGKPVSKISFKIIIFKGE